MATTPLAPTPSRTEAATTTDAADDLRSILLAAAARPETRTVLLAAAGCLGLLGLIFGANLEHFVHTWSTDENYSHGFLVPVISLYFANQAARRGPVAVR